MLCYEIENIENKMGDTIQERAVQPGFVMDYSIIIMMIMVAHISAVQSNSLLKIKDHSHTCATFTAPWK